MDELGKLKAGIRHLFKDVLCVHSQLKAPLIAAIFQEFDDSYLRREFDFRKLEGSEMDLKSDQAICGCLALRRKRVLVEEFNLAMQFLDESVPVQSGRDYRILKTTKNELFCRYVEWTCEQGRQPFSKTFFIYKVVNIDL